MKPEIPPLRLQTVGGVRSSGDMGVCETLRFELRGGKMWAWCFCWRRQCERREGATMGCVVRGFDWEGDRGYVGVLKELLISVCARVCVRVWEDDGWPWKMHPGLLRMSCSEGLLRLDCLTVIEVLGWTRARRPQPSTHSTHTHTTSILIHTLNKTPVFNKVWSYRPELCCCVRGSCFQYTIRLKQHERACNITAARVHVCPQRLSRLMRCRPPVLLHMCVVK